MGTHLIDGEFQSDKYPSTPRGKVPLSVKDVTAQDLLWEYAQRRRTVDAEFADDLETTLRASGFVPPPRESRSLVHVLARALKTVIETRPGRTEEYDRAHAMARSALEAYEMFTR